MFIYYYYYVKPIVLGRLFQIASLYVSMQHFVDKYCTMMPQICNSHAEQLGIQAKSVIKLKYPINTMVLALITSDDEQMLILFSHTSADSTRRSIESNMGW